MVPRLAARFAVCTSSATADLLSGHAPRGQHSTRCATVQPSYEVLCSRQFQILRDLQVLSPRVDVGRRRKGWAGAAQCRSVDRFIAGLGAARQIRTAAAGSGHKGTVRCQLDQPPAKQLTKAQPHLDGSTPCPAPSSSGHSGRTCGRRGQKWLVAGLHAHYVGLIWRARLVSAPS